MTDLRSLCSDYEYSVYVSVVTIFVAMWTSCFLSAWMRYIIQFWLCGIQYIFSYLIINCCCLCLSVITDHYFNALWLYPFSLVKNLIDIKTTANRIYCLEPVHSSDLQYEQWLENLLIRNVMISHDQQNIHFEVKFSRYCRETSLHIEFHSTYVSAATVSNQTASWRTVDGVLMTHICESSSAQILARRRLFVKSLHDTKLIHG